MTAAEGARRLTFGERLARAAAVFLDPRVLIVLLLGFSSGLPLALSGSTLLLWMKDVGVDLGTIGLFSLVGVPYTIKFLWAPIVDAFQSARPERSARSQSSPVRQSRTGATRSSAACRSRTRNVCAARPHRSRRSKGKFLLSFQCTDVRQSAWSLSVFRSFRSARYAKTSTSRPFPTAPERGSRTSHSTPTSRCRDLAIVKGRRRHALPR